MTTLQLALAVLAAAVALWLVALIVLDRVPGDWLYGAVALLEVGLVAQLVLGLVRLTGDHPSVNTPAYVGYLIGSLFVLPIAFLWSVGERTRSGTAVLLLGVFVVPVLFLRLHDLWAVR